MSRRPPTSTLFPYTTLFRSSLRSTPATATSTSNKSGLRRLEPADDEAVPRSEEHTSELQSRENLVCRLLLEKKNVPLNRPVFTYQAQIVRPGLNRLWDTPDN